MPSSSRRRFLLVPVAASLGGCSALTADASGRTVRGTVDHKTVVVRTDGSSTKDAPVTKRIIGVGRDGDVYVADELDRSRVFEKGDVAVTPEFASDLRRRYDTVGFAVNFELEERDPVNEASPHTGMGYEVSREQFNALAVGESVQFVVAEDGDSIESIVDDS